MTFRMSRLTKSKSGAFAARKAIPQDVREQYERLFGKRREESFHKKPDASHGEAKAAHAAWLAEIEARIAAIRTGARGEGRSLTHKEAHALAGEWYRWYVARHEANPGKASTWSRGSVW
jgi:hypothetical protein